jgi:putative Holliday junction resolvase
MYISLDIGLKRIGVAMSADHSIVTPLPAITRKNRNQAANEVKAVINEWKATDVIVGIPMGGSSEDEMRRRVNHFVGLLDFSGDVHFQDESDSSLEAEDRMKGEIKYKRDGRVDSIAAMIILERFVSRR